MGEVYRAMDTRLGRYVALKVLPAELSQSRLRIRRFLQEAKAASSLNHPNILTVFDAGEAGELHFIVSELIAGNTLRDLIHRDHVALKRLVEYLAQAADGIAKAHAAGIIHRDLKPDNIMVTADGFAKVLDFGLAKLTEGPDEMVTIPDRTREGVIIGTAAYMSPEQAQGKSIDHRSDIFSFGAILYEAAGRKRPFAGPSDPDTLHQIIHDEPAPLAGIPTELDRLITRALAKDPEERIQSMKDVALELRDISRSYDSLRVRTAVRRRVSLRGSTWMAIAAIAFIAGAGIGYRIRRSPAGGNEPIRFAITPPERTTFTATPNSSTALQFAVSPSGKSIAFVASGPSSKPLLWVRDLGSVEARPLNGTEGAWFPFWSPEGTALGFFADGKMKRISIGGGAPAVLTDASDPRGGTWSRDGVILYAPAIAGPIYRIPEGGGDPAPATALNAARHERGHRWPHFLPDGKHFVYLSLGPSRGIYAGTLGSLESRPVLNGIASNVEYVLPGELLFIRGGGLYAQAIDDRTLHAVGDPVLIEQHIGYAPTLYYGSFSASPHDLIAYASRVNPNRQLTLFDRHGQALGTATEPADWGTASLSVLGDKAVMTRADVDSASLDLWLVDLTRRIASPLTSDPADENHPVWSPDGSEIVYTSNRDGLPDLYVKNVAGSQRDRLLAKTNAGVPTSWTSDGRYIIYWDRTPDTGMDLWLVSSHDQSAPRSLLRTRFNEADGAVSHDSRWLAYSSTDSGRDEVYVQPFLREGPRYQVSSSGGTAPRWSADGRELFYVTAGGEIAAVRITANKTRFETTAPTTLFRIPGVINSPPTFRIAYDVTNDGRFLMNVTPAETSVATITAVVHWRGR